MKKFLLYYVVIAFLVMIPSVSFAFRYSERLHPIITAGVLFIGFCWLYNLLIEARCQKPPPPIENDGTYVVYEDETGSMLSIAMNIPESEALAKDAITLENGSPNRSLKAERR